MPSLVIQKQAILQPIKLAEDYTEVINQIHVLAKKTRRSFSAMVLVLVERAIKIVNIEEGIAS